MPTQKATRQKLPDLPVQTCLPALREALSRGHAVLTAEPGSGKTTLVPLLLLDEAWLAGRKIVILEPRRPAARMAARRMADLLGESPGGTVGYQVRFERRISAASRIEVLTEGLLLRRLQADPELADVGLVIFDEFHERSLQGDLSLALSLDVIGGLREDLRLLIMSASLDPQPLVDLLPARAVSAEGRSYPVEVQQAVGDIDPRDPLPACLRALGQVLGDQSGVATGDVLVFLPGRREIERLLDEVRGRWGDSVDAFPLYGDLSAEQQDVVLRGNRSGRRRVIAATDIAETSLTIEGVSAVVDSGLARKPVFDPNTGLTRLETRWISKASALQRAGRAGRLGPGVCCRAWSAARQARLDDWTAPEVRHADLAALVLEMANWGINSSAGLRWLDQPPPAHWQQATILLQTLDALDDRLNINALGRDMARFPVHPRLAHVLASASGAANQRLAADVAALLSERDPLPSRRAGAPFNDAGSDLGMRLEALHAMRDKRPLPGRSDRRLLRRIDQVAQQFLRLCRKSDSRQPADMTVGQCIALAYPDRVAACSSADGRRYLMRNGRAAMLDEHDPLRGRPFLAIGAVDAGRREGRVWLAAALEDDTFLSLFEGQIEVRREVRWDAALADVVARTVRRLDAIVLSDEPGPLRRGDPVGEVLIAQIRRDGLAGHFKSADDLTARVATMRRADPDGPWPDFSEKGLLASLETWLPPWLRDGEGVRQLRRLDLHEILSAQLGWQLSQKLEQLLPLTFETPAGTRRRYSYDATGDPVLALPLQEMLGQSTGPLLANGRVPVILHLLSPAGRPLQVTSDLAGFWAGTYDDVKKEMRGRYPKHFWPDDPAQARATRFTKRRMRDD